MQPFEIAQCGDYQYGYHIFRDFEKAVVLDLATTGLNPHHDRIIRLTGLKINFKEESERKPEELQPSYEFFDEYYNPNMGMDQAAIAIHQITLDELSGCKLFGEDAQNVRHFIQDLPIICYNLEFDLGFMESEMQRAGEKSLLENNMYCIQHRYWFYQRKMSHSTLNDVARAFQLQPAMKHDLVSSVKLVAQIAYKFYLIDTGRV